jgi:hypothetical protein
VAQRLVAATAEIERLRGELARVEEENRAFLATMRHMNAAAESVLEEARAEAAETRARVAAEAYERLVVARADARAALHEERARAADELELLAAVREKVAAERETLTLFHTQMSGKLRHLVHAMLDFADRPPSELEAAPEDGDAIEVVGTEADGAPAAEPTDGRGGAAPAPHDPIGAHDAELEQAFAEFFGGDDAEPSRGWILNEQ